MTELLTAAQMRAIEQAAIASGEVTGLELMERAGQGVVDAIFAEWPELAPVEVPDQGPAPGPPEFSGQDEERSRHRAVVLCGPGNNGGDGFVVARLLKERGWEVEVFLYGDPEKLPPDAKVNCERWGELGEVYLLDMPHPSTAQIAVAEKSTRVTQGDPGPALIIDAIFGTGLTRPITDLDRLLEECQLGGQADDTYYARPPHVVAVDIASGLCADSGRILGQSAGMAIFPHLTIAFHRAKRGHYLSDGAGFGHAFAVVDIGLDRTLSRNRAVLAQLHQVSRSGSALRQHIVFSLSDFSAQNPMLLKRFGHKYSHGHALILSGGVGKGGAARLAARGALRIGVGAVTVGCPPAALVENAAQLNAIMLRSLKDADMLNAALEDKRINALCLGPGLGTGTRETALLGAALDGGEEPRPAVLDADALTLLAQDEGLFAKLHGRCILTPHAGEFARLFPDIAEKLNAPATKGPAYSKVDATREAAKRAGCVVLFKGPDTVIADPSGRCSISASVYERAAPWLATAGSGDVLAGFITGLLARGFAPMTAAETGAWLHTECALGFGPGLIAEDLPEELPKVLRALDV